MAASRRAALIAGVGIGAAALAALALPLALLKLPGPWLLAAWLAAVAALAAGVLALVHARRQARRLEAAESRAMLAETERDALQSKARHHDQLERELLQA